MSDFTNDRAAWIITRIGDEFGLTDENLSALYNTTAARLADQFRAASGAPEAQAEQIKADIQTAIAQKGAHPVNESQSATIKGWIARYPIRKLVPLESASGPAWRLTADDAQWIAFRVADAIGLEMSASDVLRQRLNRVAISYEAVQPEWNDALRAQIASTTIRLAELTQAL